MTKFEIKTDSFEIRFTGMMPNQSAEDIFDTYMGQSVQEPILCGSFDTLEEAKAEFAKNYTNYGWTRAERSFHGFKLLRGEIAWIEESEYDEDGEFDQSAGVWEFSAEPYAAQDDDE